VELVLAQITVADVRAMLRADALPFVLGTALGAIGLLTLGLSAVVRRRAAGPPWLGLFALLYGMRLLVRTDTFRVSLDVTPSVLHYAEAALTYIVPVPLLLVISRIIAPEWRRPITLMAYAVAVFALGAMASDLLLHRPNSARVVNNLIAVALITLLGALTLRPGLPGSREVRTVRIGAASFGLTALADNLRGMSLIHYPGPDLEPFGMTVTIACLGTLAAWRTMGEARRLVAIDRELAIARDIQASILPQVTPLVAGVTVTARYRPMTAVAGDFYDFIEMGDDRLGVLVADVTGHGVPAALIASMVKVALASQLPHADHPSAVLGGINRALCGRLADRYVTAAYLFIDDRSGVVRYAAAGHPPMLHSTPDAAGVRRIEENGLLLGFVEDATYPEAELRLDGHGRDRFLLYTDGLIEAANRRDDLFGIDGVERALASASGLSAGAAADAVLAAKDEWSGLPPADDLTLVLVDRERGVSPG
jgi:sigma-B regulation protein RsbU (phosphoserine phosphatase)